MRHFLATPASCPVVRDLLRCCGVGVGLGSRTPFCSSNGLTGWLGDSQARFALHLSICCNSTAPSGASSLDLVTLRRLGELLSPLSQPMNMDRAHARIQ